MAENDSKEVEFDNDQFTEEPKQQSGFLDNDLLLLLIILFIFFQNNSAFSEQFQFLNDNVKQIKNYLDTADATLEALDQATQIPNQMLK